MEVDRFQWKNKVSYGLCMDYNKPDDIANEMLYVCARSITVTYVGKYVQST